MKYKKNEACGIYYRIFREGKWQTVCISDMMYDELHNCMFSRDKDELIKTIFALCNTLNEYMEGNNNEN